MSGRQAKLLEKVLEVLKHLELWVGKAAPGLRADRVGLRPPLLLCHLEAAEWDASVQHRRLQVPAAGGDYP